MALAQLFPAIFLASYIIKGSCQVITSDVLINKGLNEELQCQFNNTLSNASLSSGMWYKDEVMVDQDSVFRDNGTSLLLIHATSSDTGIYDYHLSGIVVCKFNVFVGENVSVSTSSILKVGSPGYFFCFANFSISTEEVVWLKEDTFDLPTQEYVGGHVILRVDADAFTDSGNYLCVQGNKTLGNVSVTVGKIPPAVKDLECYSHYIDDNKCRWTAVPFNATNLLTNYKCTCRYNSLGKFKTKIGTIMGNVCDFGAVPNTCNITIISYNSLGSTSAFTSINFDNESVPLPPKNVMLTQGSSERLKVSWNYSEGYNDVTGHYLKYVVRYKAVDDTDWKEMDEFKDILYLDIPYQVEYFTKYVAQVKARKYSYYSEWSESAFCTTVEGQPEGKLDAKFEIKNTDKGRDIIVRWKPLEDKDANGIILAYYLSIGDSEHQVKRTKRSPANETNYIFTDVAKDRDYYINITAANSVGNSTVMTLFIKAEQFSYNLVIIVVAVALGIICAAVILFLSWNKLRKADCMQPLPEPNFLDLSMYPCDIFTGQYEAMDCHREVFDPLKREVPPTVEQVEVEHDLIQFSHSGPMIQPKQVELPPIDTSDSGLNMKKLNVEISPLVGPSGGPYARFSLKEYSPKHCNNNFPGSVDTSGFDSKASSMDYIQKSQLSPTRSMPDMSSELSSDDGYARMDAPQNSVASRQVMSSSGSCRSNSHETSGDHINDYVIRTSVPGFNQMSLPAPLSTPDIISRDADPRKMSPPVKCKPPSNDCKKKNFAGYVDHLQLKQLAKGGFSSSPNLFTSPPTNCLAESCKGNMKSASDVLKVNQTDSGYLTTSMMSSVSCHSPVSPSSSPVSLSTSSHGALRPPFSERVLSSPAGADILESPPVNCGEHPKLTKKDEASRSLQTPAASSVLCGAPNSVELSQPRGRGRGRGRGQLQHINPDVSSVTSPTTRNSVIGIVNNQPDAKPSTSGRQDDNASLRNMSLQQKPCSNKDNKINGCSQGNPGMHASWRPNAVDHSTSERTAEAVPRNIPQSLTLHRESTALQTITPNHTTTTDNETMSPVENGYIPLRSLSCPE